MARWTVRSVSAGTVQTVRRLQDETGARVGPILNACVEFGAERARAQLLAEQNVEDDLLKLFSDMRQMLGTIGQLMQEMQGAVETGALAELHESLEPG